MNAPSQQLEQETTRLAQEVYEEIGKRSTSPLQADYYAEKLMNWAMEDETFKVALFRFVDVLPSLPDGPSIIRLAQEYFWPARHKFPSFLQRGFSLSPDSITAKVAASIIKKQVSFVAERFIVGANPKAAIKKLKRIRQSGCGFTVDLLGEASLNETEALHYVDRYLELLDTLNQQAPKWSASAPLIPGHRSESTPLNISVKLSALYSQAKSLDHAQSVSMLAERLTTILTRAKSYGAFVYVDMEDSSFTSITLETFQRVAMDPQFRSYERLGIVLQAYMKRTERDLEHMITWVRERRTPVCVRLVKGAYWDSETMLCEQKGWEPPVWQAKSSTDANYEKLSRRLLEATDAIFPAFGSHNIRSLAHAVTWAKLNGVPNTDFELQTLYGMGEPIKAAFAKRGFLVREYSPVGEILPGMAYLVRRLLENTSNEGFLRQGLVERTESSRLLRAPKFDEPTRAAPKSIRETFSNIPLIDFSEQHEREALGDVLTGMVNRLAERPFEILPIINGQRIRMERDLASRSPEDTRMIVGRVQFADTTCVDRALREVTEFFPTWRKTDVGFRSDILFHVAELMKLRRAELSALITLEAGKPWAEADAEVAEAIDFCNYYARLALDLLRPRPLGQYPGETNTYFYEPRGITSVIGPWNFPLAIPCGMFAAALVTGNCAILKPAEQTSVIASVMFETFLEAGLPTGAAAFLPGLGEDVGQMLVSDPRVSTVAFTGSKDVGLSIVREASNVREGAVHVKRVIAEMGGKNAIVVDESADLDEAIRGILYSAFGYQGQKCSACSRVIVVEGAYDNLLARLVDAVKVVKVGPATAPGTLVGPVIEREAQERILKVIAEASADGTLLAQAEIPVTFAGEDALVTDTSAHGYFVPPSLFGNLPPDHWLYQREVFGPVLTIEKVASFEAGISRACKSEYGLTGGIFSRSPKNIEYAIQNFQVGNLYINRTCTGALVMRQPFGGAKMSGIGSKAGGPDYLLQFVVPRVVSENTIRRGFAPVAEA